MYPDVFIPTSFEDFTIRDSLIKVPKCLVRFEKWEGVPVKNTFGGKAVVGLDGKPMFAEMAIAKTFIAAGWQARWIETYGKSNIQPICLSDWKDDTYKSQVHDAINDEKILAMLAGIVAINKGYSGCWDVLAWKGDKVLFAESKRKGKDRMRDTQRGWLAACLEYGMKEDDLLVVEWDMK